MTAPVNRRGVCPALTAPMQTGDGLLVRLHPTSEGSSPKQLIGLCDSAARLGNGIVEITARGNFQIRGLSAESAGELASEVNDLGIEARTGVPIDISPLAGLDPAEIADPRPLADAIRDGIANAGLSRRLSPKVSVVIDGDGNIGLDTLSADVRLSAIVIEERIKWQLALAGTSETATAIDTFDTDAACTKTIEILEAIAGLGIDARARDLLAELRSAAAPNTPSPSCLRQATSPPLHGGEEPKLEERRHLRTGVPRPREAGERWHAKRDGEGETVQQNRTDLIPVTDSRVALAIALPFGNARADMLSALATTAEALSVTDLRFAPGRRLLALCPNLDTAARLAQTAAELGFITDPADPRLTISACAGAPACASAHIDTKNLAAELAETAPKSGDIHVSGCAKGCAHPAPAALTLVGGENGVGLVVNGTAWDLPLAYATPKALATRLAQLPRLTPDEIAAAFARG